MTSTTALRKAKSVSLHNSLEQTLFIIVQDRLKILADHKYKPSLAELNHKNYNQGRQGDAQEEEGPRYFVQELQERSNGR